MLISYREFYSQLRGARAYDAVKGNFKMESCLWELFAFDERGAHYIRREYRDRDDNLRYWTAIWWTYLEQRQGMALQ